ncbi:MAG: ATP-binding protein [archaeon]|nr:ATP-binding protein [archaeon]
MSLEKLRFKDKLTVNYELTDTEFNIPALTLQMLVENAIKHGVTIKEEGGTVTVRTYRSALGHTVLILDDGVGFDTSQPVKEDGRSHIGLANVKQRIEEMTGGTLSVESEVGKGTKIMITIPFHRQDVST